MLRYTFALCDPHLYPSIVTSSNCPWGIRPALSSVRSWTTSTRHKCDATGARGQRPDLYERQSTRLLHHRPQATQEGDLRSQVLKGRSLCRNGAIQPNIPTYPAKFSSIQPQGRIQNHIPKLVGLRLRTGQRILPWLFLNGMLVDSQNT